MPSDQTKDGKHCINNSFSPRPDPEACEAKRSSPPREAGGTTGAGNLSAGQANRTGGATGGLPDPAPPVKPARRDVKPDA